MKLLLPSFLFSIAGYADVLLTQHLLNCGCLEANPLAAFFIDNVGAEYLGVYKALITASVIFIVWLASTLSNRSFAWILWFGAILTGAVVCYSSVLVFFSENLQSF